jgi:hypothetical protein
MNREEKAEAFWTKHVHHEEPLTLAIITALLRDVAEGAEAARAAMGERLDWTVLDNAKQRILVVDGAADLAAARTIMEQQKERNDGLEKRLATVEADALERAAVCAEHWNALGATAAIRALKETP